MLSFYCLVLKELSCLVFFWTWEHRQQKNVKDIPWSFSLFSLTEHTSIQTQRQLKFRKKQHFLRCSAKVSLFYFLRTGDLSQIFLCICHCSLHLIKSTHKSTQNSNSDVVNSLQHLPIPDTPEVNPTQSLSSVISGLCILMTSIKTPRQKSATSQQLWRCLNCGFLGEAHQVYPTSVADPEGSPLPPRFFLKIMQCSGNFKGKTPILSKFWAQPPPLGSKLHWASDQNPGSAPEHLILCHVHTLVTVWCQLSVRLSVAGPPPHPQNFSNELWVKQGATQCCQAF